MLKISLADWRAANRIELLRKHDFSVTLTNALKTGDIQNQTQGSEKGRIVPICGKKLSRVNKFGDDSSVEFVSTKLHIYIQAHTSKLGENVSDRAIESPYLQKAALILWLAGAHLKQSEFSGHPNDNPN